MTLLLAFAAGFWAQGMLQPWNSVPPPPAPILKEVGVDQKPGARIPLHLQFRDESGRAATLGEFFGKRPVILAPVYYGCPRLCGEILRGLAGSIKAVGLRPGQDFDVVVFSFDPEETPALAASKKQSVLRRNSAGWHLLTGGPREIEELTAAIGYRYAFDEKAGQYAHPGAVLALTPGGRISRYIYGVEYAPRDLRLALIEASAGTIGTAFDQFLLLCYHYDPSMGKYTNTVLGALRWMAVATLAGFGAFFLVMFRKERAR
jgi:protein SCO1